MSRGDASMVQGGGRGGADGARAGGGAGSGVGARAGARPGKGMRWVIIAVAVIGSILGLGVLTALLLPPLRSALEVQVVEQSQTFAIGSSNEVTLDAGWSAQPGLDGGLLLRSPDRVLDVRLNEVTAVEADHALEPESGSAAEPAPTPQAVLTETLENGATVRHVELDHGWVVALETTGGVVLIEAEVHTSTDPAEYRTALAQLLLRVQPTG